jgi:hypothetical protein
VGRPPFDDARGAQHTVRELPVSDRWVRRLAHRGRDYCATRAAPRRLAWASPAESTAGPSQRAEAVGHSAAQHCVLVFILFIFVGIFRNCCNLLKSLEMEYNSEKCKINFG